MKFKLTKAEYDALPDNLKVLYVADGEGFKLPLTDYEDAGEMRRARDREKAEAATAKTALAAAQAELDKLTTDPARKAGDIATLEKSWQQKLDAATNASTATITKLKSTLEKTLIDNATAAIAGKITGTPEHAALLALHVERRLGVVYDGDVPTVKVKDAAGAISATSFDELQTEFVGNKLYSSLVVGSKASGAGSAGQRSSASAGGAGKKLMELPESERVALYRIDPAAYTARYESEKAVTA
jgi:hypothetical protein